MSDLHKYTTHEESFPDVGSVDVVDAPAGTAIPAGLNAVELPSGLIVANAPEGLLEFLTGTAWGEGGGNYYREQIGFTGHLTHPPSLSSPEEATEGYGQYQFTGQNAMAVAAEQANWDPYTQDEVAAAQAIAYWHLFGGDWKKVSQAWWGGPGASFIGDEYVNGIHVSPDWAGIETAFAGHDPIAQEGSSWEYGPGYQGAPPESLIAGELKLQHALPGAGMTITGTTGASGSHGGATPGQAAGATASSLGSSFVSGLEGALVSDARNLLEMVAGVLLIYFGVKMLASDLGASIPGITRPLRSKAAAPAPAPVKQPGAVRSAQRKVKAEGTERTMDVPTQKPLPGRTVSGRKRRTPEEMEALRKRARQANEAEDREYEASRGAAA